MEINPTIMLKFLSIQKNQLLKTYSGNKSDILAVKQFNGKGYLKLSYQKQT